MSIWVGLIVLLLWIYVYYLMYRANLKAWKYFWGSCGLFIIMMIWLRPMITQPLAKVVASVAGIFGDITGMFSAFFKYGVLYVATGEGAITLQIDFECSGVLEIMAFLALLSFFEAYNVFERIIVGILGTIYIILANAMRISIICTIIYFNGVGAYHVAHTIVGRIVFYALTVILYFFVFTKTQIIRQKVGGFAYGHDK